MEDKAVPLEHLIDYFNHQITASGSPTTPRNPLVMRQERVLGHFGAVELGTAFQPVVRGNSEHLFGYEALLRPRAGNRQRVEPSTALRAPTNPNDIIQIERLTRSVHLLNYLSCTDRHRGALFLKAGTPYLSSLIGDQGPTRGWYFETILCGLLPQHVIIDVHASSILGTHAKHVRAVLANYRAWGYRVAIHGLVLSDEALDLLERVRADIVKLDVQSLLEAGIQEHRLLRRLLEHTPIEVIATGIETSDQARAARALGFDGLQGFYLGSPEESFSQLGRPRDQGPFALEAAVSAAAGRSVGLQFCY